MKINPKTLSLWFGVSLTCLLLSSPAKALTKTICIKVDMSFTDENAGEDYWTNDSVDRPIPGVYVDFDGQGLGGTSAASFVGQTTQNGCFTAWFPSDTNDIFLVDVKGVAVVDADTGGSNVIIAKRFTSSESYAVDTLGFSVTSGSSGPINLRITGTFDPDIYDTFHAMATSADVLSRHAGGLTGEYLQMRVGSGAGNSWNGTYLNLTEYGAHRKFTIAHELGHFVARRGAGVRDGGCHLFNFEPGRACAEQPLDGTNGNDNHHSMRSKEQTRCAVSEGFGYFYAALAWNDPTDTGAFIQYAKAVQSYEHWETVVDVEKPSFYELDPTCTCPGGGGSPPCSCGAGSSWPCTCSGGSCGAALCYTSDHVFPEKYLETQCVGSEGLPGHGVELDWMRHFWDMVSDGTDTGPYGDVFCGIDLVELFATLGTVDWAASPRLYNETYDQLEDQMPSWTSGTRLCWLSSASYNGIDWPLN